MNRTRKLLDAEPLSRAETMARVRSKDTKPELLVRRLLHAMGYRFRLHHRRLPGHPDIVFIGRRKAIFIHGCFWHGHQCTRGNRLPKTNSDYWRSKIGRNRNRDAANQDALTVLGWSSLVVWECELKLEQELRERLLGYLEEARP